VPKEAVAAARDPGDGEEQIVAHRELPKQQRGLIGAAQAAADPLMRRQVGHILAEEADPPFAGREIAGDRVEQRRLAGAVGAEHAAALAGGDRE
jgi:hypothetical protein